MFIHKLVHRLFISEVIFLALACSHVFAADLEKSQVRYEAGLAIPWAHMDSIFRSEFSIDREQVYEISHALFTVQDIPIIVPKAKLSVQLSMDPGAFTAHSAAWSLSSAHIAIETSPFSIEKTYYQNIGGALVAVRLVAQCHGITLTQQSAQGRLGVLFQVNGLDVQSKIEELKLHWNQEWSVQPVVCEGPQGFGELIGRELREYLSNTSIMEELVKRMLQSKLDQQISKLVQMALVPHLIYAPENESKEKENRIELKYKKIESLGDVGILVVADLIIPDQSARPSGSSQEGVLVPLTVAANDIGLVRERPVLFLSNEALSQSAQAMLLSSTYRGDLLSLPSFQSLLRSRFFQFFVWWDLRKYSKDSKFPFQARIQKISQMSLGKGLSFKIAGAIQSRVKSFRDGKIWDYLGAFSLFKTRGSISVKNGSIQLDIMNPSLRTEVAMAPEYIETFRPSQFVASWILDSSALNALRSEDLALALPRFSVGTSLYRAGSLNRSSRENIAVEFEN
jgi:hypothetical protein